MSGFIAVHVGAGFFSTQSQATLKACMKEACKEGQHILQSGGSASDAVAASIAMLEDCQLTNAGIGSCLTNKGTVECDACVMDGRNLRHGAVASVSGVPNPVRLAHSILLEQTRRKTGNLMQPSLLVGKGARVWGERRGIPTCDASVLITEKSFNQYKSVSRHIRRLKRLERRKREELRRQELTSLGCGAAPPDVYVLASHDQSEGAERLCCGQGGGAGEAWTPSLPGPEQRQQETDRAPALPCSVPTGRPETGTSLPGAEQRQATDWTPSPCSVPTARPETGKRGLDVAFTPSCPLDAGIRQHGVKRQRVGDATREGWSGGEEKTVGGSTNTRRNQELAVANHELLQSRLDTVGCVAVDGAGHVAAGVSSGGIIYKQPGRVGQSAVFGAGCWAEDDCDGSGSNVASSTTGLGEMLVSTQLASSSARLMAHRADPLQPGLHQHLRALFLDNKFLSSYSHHRKRSSGCLLVRHSPLDGSTDLYAFHTTASFGFAYMGAEHKRPTVQFSSLPPDQEGQEVMLAFNSYFPSSPPAPPVVPLSLLTPSQEEQSEDHSCSNHSRSNSGSSATAEALQNGEKDNSRTHAERCGSSSSTCEDGMQSSISNDRTPSEGAPTQGSESAQGAGDRPHGKVASASEASLATRLSEATKNGVTGGCLGPVTSIASVPATSMNTGPNSASLLPGSCYFLPALPASYLQGNLNAPATAQTGSNANCASLQPLKLPSLSHSGLGSVGSTFQQAAVSASPHLPPSGSSAQPSTLPVVRQPSALNGVGNSPSAPALFPYTLVLVDGGFVLVPNATTAALTPLPPVPASSSISNAQLTAAEDNRAVNNDNNNSVQEMDTEEQAQ